MMRHPRTEPGGRGVVAVIVRRRRLLVIRRSQWVIAPQTFCFPGGGILEGESEQAALVREIREELNVDIVPERRIWESVTPWGIHLAWWSAQLSDTAQFQPNAKEVESIHWWTPEEMRQAEDLLESNRMFLDALRSGHVACDLY